MANAPAIKVNTPNIAKKVEKPESLETFRSIFFFAKYFSFFLFIGF